MTVQWRAPGRVNLIGEHTDYNAGLALPFAVEQGCVATVSLGGTGIEASSAQFTSSFTVGPEELPRLPGTEAPGWARYVLGPAWALHQRGIVVPPLHVLVDSDVPLGAGLSSSAAIVCSVTAALDDALGLALSPDDLLAVARSAENDVVGAPTGGLDQLASFRCREGHVLLCDFATFATEPVPFDPAAHGLTVLVVDTRVEHGHAGGEYAERRRACAAAAAALGLDSLRELGPDRLTEALDRLDAEPLRRCARHVVTENARVEQAVALLEAGQVADIGPLMSASHASLRDDFQVSTAELDLAVGTLVEAGALGARLTGGGFGGCAIALVPDDAVDGALAAVHDAFARAGYGEPGWFTTRPAAGAHRLELQPRS